MAEKAPAKIYNHLYIRLGIILLLIVGGFVLSQKIVRDKALKKTSSLNEVLGTESKVEKNILEPLKKSGEDIVQKTVKETEKTVQTVLGVATSLVSSTASKSAEAVTDYVFQNTVGTVIKQIDKLPEKQQEEIKKQICQ